MTARWRRLGGLAAVDGDRPMLGCLVMLGLAAAAVAAAVGLVAGLWFSGHSVWDWWCCREATVRVELHAEHAGRAVVLFEAGHRPAHLAGVDAGGPEPLSEKLMNGLFPDRRPVGVQAVKDRAAGWLVFGVDGYDSVRVRSGRYVACVMGRWPIEGWIEACNTGETRGDVTLDWYWFYTRTIFGEAARASAGAADVVVGN